jgi:hypothetical protein
VAVQPELQLAAYGGHNSVVVVCCKSQSVLRTMCSGLSRVTSLAFAPTPTFTGAQLVAGMSSTMFLKYGWYRAW